MNPLIAVGWVLIFEMFIASIILCTGVYAVNKENKKLKKDAEELNEKAKTTVEKLKNENEKTNALGQIINNTLNMLNEGKYEESLEYWNSNRDMIEQIYS